MAGGQVAVSPVWGGVESLALHLGRAARLSRQAEKCSECSQILREVPRHQAWQVCPVLLDDIIDNHQHFAGRITVLSVRNVPSKWTITARGSTIASAFIITKLVTEMIVRIKMHFAVFPALLGVRDLVLPVDLCHLLPFLPPHLALQGGRHCCWITQVSKYSDSMEYITTHIK